MLLNSICDNGPHHLHLTSQNSIPLHVRGIQPPQIYIIKQESVYPCACISMHTVYSLIQIATWRKGEFNSLRSLFPSKKCNSNHRTTVQNSCPTSRLQKGNYLKIFPYMGCTKLTLFTHIVCPGTFINIYFCKKLKFRSSRLQQMCISSLGTTYKFWD